jgi:hypothetical protein
MHATSKSVWRESSRGQPGNLLAVNSPVGICVDRGTTAQEPETRACTSGPFLFTNGFLLAL